MEPKHHQRITLFCDIMSDNFFHNFLTYKDFNVDKGIFSTSYCRVGNQAVIATRNIEIITENEAAFKQIKLIQEPYDLCVEKYEDSIAQKT